MKDGDTFSAGKVELRVVHTPGHTPESVSFVLTDKGGGAGVIYPPQVALLGIGSMRQRAWVVDETVVPRQIVTFSLAADHRVSDGHAGALFLRRVDELLQNPESLI